MKIFFDVFVKINVGEYYFKELENYFEIEVVESVKVFMEDDELIDFEQIYVKCLLFICF